jgi:integrase
MAKLNFTKAAIEKLPIPAKGWIYHYDTKVRGLAIGVSHTGVRSFVVYRKVFGRPERIALGRYPDLTIEQARGKAAEVNALIAKGENPADKRRLARAEMTLGELFTEYLERYARIHKKTWQKDASMFRLYLSSWANRKLSTIRRNDMGALHARVGKEHGHYGANRMLELAQVMFNKAMEWGWGGPNPANGIKAFQEKPRDRFLQADELPRFFQALAEEPNNTIRDYLLTSLLTGARRANVLAMRWADISFERAEWRIPETKNGTPQVVALCPEAMQILQARPRNGDYVFPGPGRHGHLVEPKKGWARILERAGIKDLRIHDLRRTLGSWQAKAGASLVIIDKSLNHKSVSITAIYARLDLDPVRESVNTATANMLAAAGVKSVAEVVKLKGDQAA